MSTTPATAAFSEWSTSSIVTGSLTLMVIYMLTSWIYHAYFDALSAYPGPKLFAASWLPFSYYQLLGRLPYKTASIHAKYGPVVRLSPNSLSYIDAAAWSDIYARTRPQLAKDPDVGPPPPNGVKGLAFAERDEDHARMRRNLAHGFTEKALRDQEALLNGYFDLFTSKVREASQKGPVDMVDYFNFVTVDLVGELTFGRSFDCLTSANLHPWMENIFHFLKAFVIVGTLSRFRPLGQIIMWIGKRAPGFAEKEKLHRGFINDRLEARLSKEEPGTDLFVLAVPLIFLGKADECSMTYVQKHTNTPSGMSIHELQETCNALMIGGSETTASALSGAVYYLLRNPGKLRILQEEVRTAFSKEEEITLASTNTLRYLHAVLQESMRIFPPLPSQITRMTGPTGATICNRPVPADVSVTVSHWSAYRSPTNFHEPLAFHPERFLSNPPEQFVNDNRKVFQPFSVGPRGCIGVNLAWAEMRMLLAKLVWAFDWELDAASESWPEGMGVWAVYEKGPLWVRLSEVQR